MYIMFNTYYKRYYSYRSSTF